MQVGCYIADMNKTILVVEDERFLGDLLEARLQFLGYQVYKAYDGVEALDILSRYPIDLLLLDLLLPEVDGFAVLDKLKRSQQETPVIVNTNVDNPEQIQRVKSYGVREYFVKANTPLMEIVNYVERFLS